MKTIKEILIEARALIEDPRNWIQNTNAMDANRNKVISEDESAVLFCVNGAIRQTCGGFNNDDYRRAADALRITADFLFQESPISVNDEKGHAAVLQLIDAAISEQGE